MRIFKIESKTYGNTTIEIDREEFYQQSEGWDDHLYWLAFDLINELNLPAENKELILFIINSINFDYEILKQNTKKLKNKKQKIQNRKEKYNE